MNYKMLSRIIGLTFFIEAGFMTPALVLCLADGDTRAAHAFLQTMGLLIAAGGALVFLLGRNAPRGFFAREGLVCVSASWLFISLGGCLPFYLSGEIPVFIDALFEIVSGFTTTGSSVVPLVEELPRGILYWRSFSHWLGGMGVLVFLLAVVPISGRNEGFTMHLLRAESPGPNVGKLVPRMNHTALILYAIYMGLTILCFLFLVAGQMPWFDALCTTFGAAGTGGFGIKADSMASYSSYIQMVTATFLILFGVNFGCYYYVLIRRFTDVIKDEELRLYLGVIGGAVALIALNTRGLYATVGETVRHAMFQVSSIITTAGFTTTDFELWPTFSKVILLTLMVIGACAGSTGGGIKCIRILLLLRILGRNVRQVLYPQHVKVIRVNGHTMSETVLANTNAYLAAYSVILVLSFLVVSADNVSLITALSAVLTCFNNVGPGLEAVGPMFSFHSLSALSKAVLIFDMLAGRLEIFPMLIFLSPSTWTRR